MSLSIGAVLCVCGCQGDPERDPLPEAISFADLDLALVPENEVDILLVIDKSRGGTRELQEELGRRLPAFFDALTGDSELPDVHVGVVSSDAGPLGVTTGDEQCDDAADGGALLNNGCPAATDVFLSDTSDGAGGRIRNYVGFPLEDVLACMIRIGELGCGFERHFESMRLALDDHPANVGFLRPTAQLAVLILADEDDCSASDPAVYVDAIAQHAQSTFACFAAGVICDEPDPTTLGVHTNCRSNEMSEVMHSVGSYASFLEALRPGRVVVATLVGDRVPVMVGRRTPMGGAPEIPSLEGSCTAESGGISVYCTPGIRQTELALAFGARGAPMRVCGDFESQLAAFGALIRDRLKGQPCLRHELVDGDPAAACTVTVVDIDAPASSLAACDATESNPPCWRLVEDVAQCGPAPTALRLDAVGVEARFGRRVEARCEVWL